MLRNPAVCESRRGSSFMRSNLRWSQQLCPCACRAGCSTSATSSGAACPTPPWGCPSGSGSCGWCVLQCSSADADMCPSCQTLTRVFCPGNITFFICAGPRLPHGGRATLPAAARRRLVCRRGRPLDRHQPGGTAPRSHPHPDQVRHITAADNVADGRPLNSWP